MRKIVISAMIGNALEWYDYALYAQFAPIITKAFFPESEISHILTFAVFAAGFVVRPLGGIFFGFIGDKFGRKAALVLGILTMAIPTACIGLLPTYQTIGLAAPIILVFIRLIQGFSLGGEFSGCIAYIVEHAQAKNRGLAGSSSFISMCAGMLFGLLTSKALTYYMAPSILLSYGWRLPFIAGLFIGIIGIYIRSNLTESPLYQTAKANGHLSKFPIKEILLKKHKELMIAIGIYISVTAPFYIATVYMESFTQSLGYSYPQSFTCSVIILTTMIIILPISAYISDKIGRKPLLIVGIVLIATLIYPIFVLINSMNFTYMIIGQILLAIICAIYMGPVPTILVELFPTKNRFTAIALSYNISAALFGGSAPMIASLLIKLTNSNYAISYYLILLTFISIMAIIYYKETSKIDLAANYE